MSLCIITKSEPEMIVPCEATPSGTLPLSCMDRTAVVRDMVDLQLVFQAPPVLQAAAKVVKGALCRALVPYYPVAGRIVTEAETGELVVDCDNTGVCFVEALANCSLEDVNNLEMPLMVAKDHLIPSAPLHLSQENLIFMMQVTSFSCGGVVVGFRFNHTIFDGLGVAQFLKAIGDMASDVTQPSIQPVWLREAIPNPIKLSHSHSDSHSRSTSSVSNYCFETSIFDLSMDHINNIKDQFALETGQRCTTFDAVTSIVWQCRTRAISYDQDLDVHLAFPVNVRPLLHQVLPKEGYYGNCVYLVCITSSSMVIAKASIVTVVGLIRDAKERLGSRFLDWMSGVPMEDPNKVVPLEYGALVVTDWSRLGFFEVNFGWGEPMHVAPLGDDSYLIASCIYLFPRRPKLGVRLMTRCVEREHLATFNEQISMFV